jgi:phosphatidylglycerophosphatase A
MFKLFLTIGIFFLSTFAFGEGQISEIPDVPDVAPWWLSMFTFALKQFPAFNAWFAAAMMFVMAGLRALSELLNFIAKKTATKTDDEMASALVKILKWVAAIIGWFGLGKPRSS